MTVKVGKMRRLRDIRPSPEGMKEGGMEDVEAAEDWVDLLLGALRVHLLGQVVGDRGGSTTRVLRNSSVWMIWREMEAVMMLSLGNLLSY